MSLNVLTNEEIKTLAQEVGVSAGYLRLIRYGHRRPSPDLAARIEAATGGRVSKVGLLFPDPDPDQNERGADEH